MRYRQAVKDVEEAYKQTQRALEILKTGKGYEALSSMSGEVTMQLIRLVAPRIGQVLDVTHLDEQVKAMTGAGAQLGAEHLKQVYERLHAKLGAKLDDSLDPAMRLGLALGRDLREFAKKTPLLLFFDTYEVIAEGDRLLRMVMAAAGVRVGWVLAGRDDLWADYQRAIGVIYGYQELVHSDRGLPVNLSARGGGALSLSDIEDYFAQLCKQAQEQDIELPVITQEQARAIWGVTLGVPLAVQIAAGVYANTADVRHITEAVGGNGQRELIDKMVKRYLLHAGDDLAERARLYGLALLRRADQPAAIAAALGLTPAQAATGEATKELIRLHRRYGFIFTEKTHPALHQEVRHFLRLALREGERTKPEIKAVIEHLRAAHEASLAQLEQDRQYGSLKERVQDEEWVGVYLDLTEQQFWLSPADGVRSALPLMIAAAIYRREVPQEGTQLGDSFEQQMTNPERQWWQWATASLLFATNRSPSEEALAGLKALADLAAQRRLAFRPPLPNGRDELEAALWWRIGEACLYQDDDRAVKWFEQALARLGEEAELKDIAARAYRVGGLKLFGVDQYAEMIPVLNRAIHLNPTKASAYISRGLAYMSLQENQRAIADFTQAIELEPTSATAYSCRGVVYDGLQDYQRAIADATQALQFDPKDAVVYYNRGMAYYHLQDYQQAIADYTQALQLDPKIDTTYFSQAIASHDRGMAYAKLQDYQRAIADYTQALQLDSQDATAYFRRGLAYDNLQDYERAIADYTQALQLDPKDALAYFKRGSAYTNLQDYERAIADLTQALELDYKEAAAYYKRGMAYYYLQDYKRAIADLTQAIELDAKDASACFGRGSAYANLQDYERAIADFTQAIQLDPKDAAAYSIVYSSRGLAYHYLQDYERAIADYAQALQLDARAAPVYFRRGLAYYDLQDYERAITDYTQAIQLDPQNAVVYHNRGWAYYHLQDYQQAITDYTQAIQLDPQDATAYSRRGAACLRLKNTQQAQDDYRQSYELDRTHINAAWMAEWAGMGKERIGSEVAERLRHFAEIDPTKYVAFVCRGVALGVNNHLKEGLEELEQAIQQEPDEWDACFWMGMLCAYRYPQQPHKAKGWIAKALELGLPPALLTPLYWLENDRPAAFAQCYEHLERSLVS